MKRLLLQSTAFVHAARRLLKNHLEAAPHLHAAFTAMTEDAFQPTLRTHTLKGELADSWAYSIGYDLRIVFTFLQHEGAEATLLQTVGTHDEVY